MRFAISSPRRLASWNALHCKPLLVPPYGEHFPTCGISYLWHPLGRIQILNKWSIHAQRQTSQSSFTSSARFLWLRTNSRLASLLSIWAHSESPFEATAVRCNGRVCGSTRLWVVYVSNDFEEHCFSRYVGCWGVLESGGRGGASAGSLNWDFLPFGN